MVATASTEHSYWLALTFLAVFVYATHATQAIAFEWKPGLSDYTRRQRHVNMLYKIRSRTFTDDWDFVKIFISTMF